MAMPTFTSTINDDGSALLTDDDGRPRRLNTTSVEQARREVFQEVSTQAEQRDESVLFISVESDQAYRIVIHPNGDVEELSPEEAGALEQTPNTPTTPPTPVVGAVDDSAPVTIPRPPAVQDEHRHSAFTREPTGRTSFIKQAGNDRPACKGWRGTLTRLGIRMAPSEEELAERVDIAAVSQRWLGPRTIAVTNPKGGAAKTPIVVLICAVLARYGGDGVLAWDNNQTRGTLGWRTEQGPHQATLLDLLPFTDRLLSAQAQIADLASFFHHQRADKFDVLRSKTSEIASGQRISPDDVRALHKVASKYCRMIVMDSGNDESDPMWKTMVDLSDQLVVATTNRDEPAEAGALMLETLTALGPDYADLVRNAVVIVSIADKEASRERVQRIVDGFSSMVREVVTIPFDPAIIDGHLAFDNLRSETQRAALAAAAAVARGLD